MQSNCRRENARNLTLMVALHLESLRLYNSLSSSGGGRNANGGSVATLEDNDGDGADVNGSNVTTRLLRGVMWKLENKLSMAVDKINDACKEMRCLAADVNDE
jgi:hypothetical protein